MKIALLSRNAQLYSTRRIIEAIKSRGHDVVILDCLRCHMSIATHNPTLHCHGKELNDIDAVIPRIGSSVGFYGTAVVRQFEMMDVIALNSSTGIIRAQDKLHSLQLLSCQGIGLPITGFASCPDEIETLIHKVGGTPLVIKLLSGTQGIGVVLAETEQAASSIIEAFMGVKANILVQEYIKEAEGADIRCFVIGDKVVAAMERKAKPGEFRSNLHRGGSSRLIDITEEERLTAIKSAKILGLNVAGVDILRSYHGPVVMEVNSSPGLEGIEKATGKDIAGMIIEFLETTAQFNSQNTQQRQINTN